MMLSLMGNRISLHLLLKLPKKSRSTVCIGLLNSSNDGIWQILIVIFERTYHCQ